jgi:DnaJ-class molecular chaperone
VTPYAELLCRPVDGDDEIRARFHTLVRLQHPDRPGAKGREGPHWYTLTQAYTQVKTAARREAWERHQALLSGCCPRCQGTGVTGGRLSGVKICSGCHGEGRRVI